METSWKRFQKPMEGNVVLNVTKYAKDDLLRYGDAYLNAANSLIEVFKSKKEFAEADACPIAFLYRHAIELYLKAIIHWGAELVRLRGGEFKTEKLLSTHKFEDLLPNLKRVFEEVDWLYETGTKTKFGTYKEIEELILTFEAVDQKSFAFRYPVDTKGEAHLPPGFHFNVIALGEETSGMLRTLSDAANYVHTMYIIESPEDYEDVHIAEDGSFLP